MFIYLISDGRLLRCRKMLEVILICNTIPLFFLSPQWFQNMCTPPTSRPWFLGGGYLFILRGRDYCLVGGLEHEFYDFPYIGNNHPNWRAYFFRGVGQPPTRCGIMSHVTCLVWDSVIESRNSGISKWHSVFSMCVSRSYSFWRSI